ncbi:MAG: DNA replication protein DnaC [candidate division Zixibacteria bacterium]|nr:DNA replication protein DnaC [candidate division Zixibacteria bacterium]
MANVVIETIDKNPTLKRTYRHLLRQLRRVGPITVEEKKTSVHLKAKSGFAGVHPRKDHLVLQIVSAAPIKSPRVFKVGQASKSRYHNHVRLARESDVDGVLLEWLSEAYTLMS